jgi:hypothetical protein
MKITVKNRPQSGLFFRNLEPDCCNLQSGRNLNSLIYKDLFQKSRLRTSDCGESPQSGKHPNKSTTYEQFQIACGPLSLREREANPAYAGLPLQDTVTLVGQGGAV